MKTIITHCPILRCNRKVTDKQVLCYAHWEMVPLKTRSLLKQAKGDRTSEAWKAAAKEAIQEVAAIERALNAVDYMAG